MIAAIHDICVWLLVGFAVIALCAGWIWAEVRK